jgi:hypothetical protein
MNTKRFVAAIVAAFIFIFAFNWLWHGMLLMDTYKATPDLWRPMDHKSGPTIHCLAMMLSQFFMAFMLTFIFTRNYENKGTAEGIRYGLYMGLLLAAIDLGKFAYMPVDFPLVTAWMLGSLLTALGTGLIVSWIYRKEK